MSETEEFQRLADECLTRADDPEITQQQRQLLIEMAMAWKRLGHDASKGGPPPSACPRQVSGSPNSGSSI